MKKNTKLPVYASVDGYAPGDAMGHHTSIPDADEQAESQRPDRRRSQSEEDLWDMALAEPRRRRSNRRFTEDE